MKRNILILLLMFCTLVSYAQKDTLVIIVDKNADYVLFDDNIPIGSDNANYSEEYRKGTHFSFRLRGHYYDEDYYPWFSIIYFEQVKEGYRNWNKDPFVENIAVKDLSKYKVITAKDINEIKSERTLNIIVGLRPYELDVRYVVFKRNLDKENVNLYRVVYFPYRIFE